MSVKPTGPCLLTGTSDVSGNESQQWDTQHITPVTVHAEKSLQFEMYYLYRRGTEGEVSPLANGSILHPDDLYKIIFISNKTCYVYIFQIDVSGNIEQIFPMKSFKGVTVKNTNPVRGSKTYHVPAPHASFEVVPQTQFTRMYFLASEKRNKTLEQQYNALSSTPQQDLLRKQLAREKLLHTIQLHKLSSIAPIINVELVAELPRDIPATEREIVKTLRLRPSIQSDSLNEEYEVLMAAWMMTPSKIYPA